MRRFFGFMLLLLGLLGFAGGIFLGFGGKYGPGDFIKGVSRGRFDPSTLVIVMPGLALLVWGALLLKPKKPIGAPPAAAQRQ